MDWQFHHQTVRLLYQQGKSKRQIAQELHLSRWLVRRFVETEQFPERAPKSQRRTTILTPYEPLLQEQWQQGERTTPTLFRLLQAEGYSGSIHTVRHWVQQHRQEPAPHTKPAYRARYTVASEEVATRATEQRRLPAARRLVWLLLNDPEDLAADDQELLKLLLEEPSIATIYPLVQQFLLLVRQRDLSALDDWLSACVSSNVPKMANFASGLEQDEAAVRAALTLPWSTEHVAYCTSSPASSRFRIISPSGVGGAGGFLGAETNNFPGHCSVPPQSARHDTTARSFALAPRVARRFLRQFAFLLPAGACSGL